MRKLLGLFAFFCAWMSCYAQTDSYQIVVQSNTVASDGKISWSCTKNGTTVYASRQSTFPVGMSNSELRAYLKERLAACISDNSGTITSQLESDSPPPVHGATQHDATVEAVARKDVANGYVGTDSGNKMVAARLPTSYTAPLTTALAADPADCAAGQAGGGINASGVAQGCLKIISTATMSGDYTNATTTATAVNTLNFAVLASTNYIGACNITHQVSATTAGFKLSMTGPASPTAFAMTVQTSTSATTVRNDSVTAFSTLITGAATTLITTSLPVQVSFRLQNGLNNGTLQLNAASFGVGTLTIKQNVSYCWMRAE